MKKHQGLVCLTVDTDPTETRDVIVEVGIQC